MRRFILFFVRLKLGVKKNESFRFVNQKSDAKYGISDTMVWKSYWKDGGLHREKSNVSINWLLSPECEIEVE